MKRLRRLRLSLEGLGALALLFGKAAWCVMRKKNHA